MFRHNYTLCIFFFPGRVTLLCNITRFIVQVHLIRGIVGRKLRWYVTQVEEFFVRFKLHADYAEARHVLTFECVL